MKKKENNKIKSRKMKQKKIIVFILLRFLVIICMIDQGFKGNWNNVLLCILTLILFTVPTLLSKRFNIELPKLFESIVYIFIFSAEILGEIQNFYGIFAHWDSILHTLNGFICAAVGFSLVDILNSSENNNIRMSPAFAALVAFSFSMTVGVIWEFGEFAMDYYFGKDMQKDRIITKFQSVKINKENENKPIVVKDISKTELYDKDNNLILTIDGGYLDIGIIDTIKDLFVNFIGAIIFSAIGYLYVKDREDYRFIEGLLLKIRKKEE